MPKLLVLISPTSEVEKYARNITEKFARMCDVTLEVVSFPNSSAAGTAIEQGNAEIIFFEHNMDQPDANVFMGCYEKSKNKPYIITSVDNYEKIKSVTKKDKTAKASSAFTEQYMFNCIRNLLTPPDHKLDIRYIKSIVTSVIEVIRDNSDVALVPGAITEEKAKEEPEELAAVLAFNGDGFLGSLTLGTTKNLIYTFYEKMFGCKREDIKVEDLTDFLAELTNQILGVIRNELREYGYDLKASMQTVVVGDDFMHTSSSNGRYYNIPFSYNKDKFNLTLCYNTYQTSIHEIEETTVGAGSGCLDVRLLNEALDSFNQIINGNISCKIVRKDICQHLTVGYDAGSLHIFHGGGWKGGMVMAIDIPIDTAAYFTENMMGVKKNDLDSSLLNDVFGEIVNQIGGEFLKKAVKHDYRFNRVFHGDFSSTDKIHYLFKNPGLYMRILIDIDSHPLTFFFGTDSKHARQLFNIWPYYKDKPDFNKQFTVNV